MSVLFAEGDLGAVQLLWRADTGSIRDRVFEWMLRADLPGSFIVLQRN